jgi:hypothetical protein
MDVTDQAFAELCRAEPVRAEIAAIDGKRAAAIGKFWLTMLAGIGLDGLILWLVIALGWPVAGGVLVILIFLGTIVVATRPLARMIQSVKISVLQTLANAKGLNFTPGGFDPPLFPAARASLFGKLSAESFTDLFQGPGGVPAVYEAMLGRQNGKNVSVCFSGQIYAFRQPAAAIGEVVIRPGGGLFALPSLPGLERVRFKADADFDGKFDVQATRVDQGHALLGDDLRRLLLELRGAGRIWGYVGPAGVLIAVAGRNLFEPGNMFRSISGTDRVRRMFEDVSFSLAILERLQTCAG